MSKRYHNSVVGAASCCANCITESIHRARLSGSRPILFAVSAAAMLAALIMVPVALQAQDIVAANGGSETKLAAHTANVTFINSNAGSAENALKSATLSATEGKVLVAVGMKVLPIPIVGSLPLVLIDKVFRKHSAQTSKGFFVVFLPGLSAETAVSSAAASFTISAQALQSVPGALPILLRLSPSAKDSARIVRSTKANLRLNNSQMNPAITEIHETEQTVVSCRLGPGGNGEINLTPLASLPIGEYALVLTPAPTATAPEPTRVWDFRIVP